MSTRVLLVDDQALLRSGFNLMLSVEDDITVVGQVGDGQQALDFLAANPEVDVVLMDVQMPVMDGITATARIVREHTAKVVILTTFDRDDYLFDALKAGASGFLLKTAQPAELVSAVQTAAEGQALLSPQVTLRVIRAAVNPGSEGELAAHHDAGQSASAGNSGGDIPGAGVLTATQEPIPEVIDRLTDRERDVLRLLAAGNSNAEIASTLFLAEPTVKSHVSNLLAKIGVRDRLQAVVFAYRHSLDH